MRILIAGVRLLGALAGPAAGQMVAIDELRPLRADVPVHIEVVSHTLAVEGWDRNEIQIVGEYDSAREQMEIDERNGSFSFEIAQLEGRRRGRSGSDGRLEIRLPRGARLELETVSGSVLVTGINGALDGSSISGMVDVTANLTTAELTGVSGRVRYRGNARTVRLESVSGTVDYAGRAESVSLESVSGAVLMEGGAETIDAESVSGPVRILASVAVRVLDATSVSGGVDFRGSFARDAQVDVESHSGPVELVLGATPDAEFELSSFSGRVEARLAGMRDEVREGNRANLDQSLSFVTGSGTGRVEASSFSGSVRISEAR